MRCFRLVDEDYLEAAFSGEGARLYGGRWNSPGVAVVYTAQSLSLAQLELLVHLEAEAVLRGHWRYFAVDVAPRVIIACESWIDLPPDWAAWPAPTATQAIGDRWIAESVSVALSVPSAVTPGERNLLLNSAHPEYAAVLVTAPEPLRLDQRLIKG
ncbi:MAG: RES family NAD+ phosphorylase [Chromatiaceae bacterium]|nr:RES family NAD+ phosphorylase [Chromatiaceae bacterium]MBP6806696.1 RES family NAD+ phosphorylase [Chromatiaceae bacterium]MBP8288226.1 RES family NAD+ phosphorylase [Chromatiaceae bacterium]MBP9603694.1 RES family NAD+ phosphorylase [Chromatiaceae bacterium]